MDSILNNSRLLFGVLLYIYIKRHKKVILPCLSCGYAGRE